VVNVVLTPAGSAAFARMASQHEDWIAGFFDGLDEAQIEQLMALLGKLKASTRAAIYPTGSTP
jgi:DNA-binding MarR family transcriptional regulator